LWTILVCASKADAKSKRLTENGTPGFSEGPALLTGRPFAGEKKAMTERNLQLQLGLFALVASAFLIFYAIPSWISSPSNVRNVVLSPLFWPYALAGLAALTGLGLIAAGLRAPHTGDVLNPPSKDPRAAVLRLLAMAVIMVLTMFLLPRLGMVLTSMLVLAATAFLVRTRHPKTALVCAVVIPLLLYAFFAHVAGVAIPQGEVLRLP
jgi:hypothetical protein